MRLLLVVSAIRYDTIEEFNVDAKESVISLI